MKKLLSLLLAVCMVFPLLGNALAFEPEGETLDYVYEFGMAVNELIVEGNDELKIVSYTAEGEHGEHGLYFECTGQGNKKYISLVGNASTPGKYILWLKCILENDCGKFEATYKVRFIIKELEWNEKKYNFSIGVGHNAQYCLINNFDYVRVTECRLESSLRGEGITASLTETGNNQKIVLSGKANSIGRFVQKYTLKVVPKESPEGTIPTECAFCVDLLIPEEPVLEEEYSITATNKDKLCEPVLIGENIDPKYMTKTDFVGDNLYLDPQEYDVWFLCGTIENLGTHNIDIYYVKDGKSYVNRVNIKIEGAGEERIYFEVYDLTVEEGQDVNFQVYSHPDMPVKDFWLTSDNDEHGLSLKDVSLPNQSGSILNLVGTAGVEGEYKLKIHMMLDDGGETPKEYTSFVELDIKKKPYSSIKNFTLISGVKIKLKPFQCENGITYSDYSMTSDKEGHGFKLTESPGTDGNIIYLTGTADAPGKYTLIISYKWKSESASGTNLAKVTLDIKKCDKVYEYTVETGDHVELIAAEYKDCVSFDNIVITPKTTKHGLKIKEPTEEDIKNGVLCLSGEACDIGSYRIFIDATVTLENGETIKFTNCVKVKITVNYCEAYDYTVKQGEEVNLLAFANPDNKSIGLYSIPPLQKHGLELNIQDDKLYIYGTAGVPGDYQIDVYFTLEGDTKALYTCVNLHVNPECDVNCDGKVNTGDAAMLLQYCAKLCKLSKKQLAVADFNGDGKVNTGDAAGLLRYLTNKK